jgi:IMP dehydrogenase/GMP reductase
VRDVFAALNGAILNRARPSKEIFMTMINNDVKLDFNDVLFVPQRSTWDTPQNRSAVNLKRVFTFKHASIELECIPIIAANMDTTGTMNMAETLTEQSMLTALHKFYSKEELKKFFNNKMVSRNYVFYSMGISDLDYDKFLAVWGGVDTIDDQPRLICIDVANGYTEKFVEFIHKVRRKVGNNAVIMAGNVVTPEMTIELIRAGVDIVKVGIGSGCFIPGSLVMTETGLKPIEMIEVGEKVLSHTGKWQEVKNTFIFTDKKEVVKINDITCTPNHEFYVLNKKYRDIVNDENIHQYAEWISASDLTKEYLLMKHK